MLFLRMQQKQKEKRWTPSFSRSLPLGQSLLLIDSNVKQNRVHVKQLAFFNLQRERLKHRRWQLDLHHVVIAGDRQAWKAERV